MDKIIGFIGSGNMGSAMVGGIVKAGLTKSENVFVASRNKNTLAHLKEEYKINAVKDNKSLAGCADILILAVKPNGYKEVIEEIKNDCKENCVIVSIAAGISIEAIEEMFDKPIHLIRTMPNTPAFVGEAMSALCPNSLVTEKEIEEVKLIFNSFGRCEVVSESLIDAVIGVSGSSPAYVYMFIEALADAAVMGGMKREQAYQFAAQAVYGSAKMVLETGIHPGILKDNVCSPAGTTIEAVRELERQGFRSAIIEASKACMDKSKEMTKKGKGDGK